MIVAAAAWAYPTLFDLPTMATEVRYAFLIIVSALAGGAMGVLAPDLLIGRIYISSILLPACACLAVLGPSEKVLAGLGVVFYLVMISGLKADHKTLVKSLSFAFENSALLARLHDPRRRCGGAERQPWKSASAIEPGRWRKWRAGTP